MTRFFRIMTACPSADFRKCVVSEQNTDRKIVFGSRFPLLRIPCVVSETLLNLINLKFSIVLQFFGISQGYHEFPASTGCVSHSISSTN
jgi:hypothetical protein